MIQTKNVHLQFANYFNNKEMAPYFYLLSKKLAEGSVCIDLNKINWEKLKEEDNGLSNFRLVSTDELKKNKFVSSGEIKKPLILSNNRLYLQRYYHYETSILNRIKAMIDTEDETNSAELLNTIKDDIPKLFDKKPENQTDWQAVAAISAVINRFSIITGGPGTGKTTTVAKLLSLLLKINPKMKIALAAPTGKAAARMAESLKNADSLPEDIRQKLDEITPSTIHRLLGTQKDSIYFRHNAENQLSHDLIIIDESSMIDIALFSKLLDAVRPDSRLILLGDKDQLASVEAGSLFGDLCQYADELNLFSRERTNLINRFLNDSEAGIPAERISESNHPLFQHIIELKHSYRFSAEEGIGKLSYAILNHQEDKISEFYDNTDPRVQMDENYSDAVFNEIADLYKEFINEKDPKEALKKFNRVRILCAVREGEEGVYSLNRKVEQWLQSKNLITLNSEFYVNRPLMVTSNNYELGLFNGDIGIVREFNGDKRVFFESGETDMKSVLPAFLEAVETVFAMTIHKSQGSEFNQVLTVLPKDSESKILTRELLYTAVTRAKEKVSVWGSRETVLSCVERRVERSSGIKERF